MKNANKSHFYGFTLIELLVVVLIIGILTAIAIPQYQTAVQKSRYATLMPLAKSVKNAEEAILMETGNYNDELSNLSISIPGTVTDNKVTNTDGTTLEVTSTDSHDFVKASKTGLNNTYVMYFAKSSNFPNEIHCEALKDNKIAKQICLSYGPTNANAPITGTDSNYEAYILEGTGNGTGSGAGSCSSGTCWGTTDMDKATYDEIQDLINSGEVYTEGCSSLVYVSATQAACDNEFQIPLFEKKGDGSYRVYNWGCGYDCYQGTCTVRTCGGM